MGWPTGVRQEPLRASGVEQGVPIRPDDLSRRSGAGTRPGRRSQITGLREFNLSNRIGCLITDATCIPLAVSLTGGNRDDVTQLIALLQAVPPVRGKRGQPRRRPDAPNQHGSQHRTVKSPRTTRPERHSFRPPLSP